jgi:serine/threonine protein phosphatase PrpC
MNKIQIKKNKVKLGKSESPSRVSLKAQPSRTKLVPILPSPSQTLLEKLVTPKNNRLQPIQTLSSATLKPSKSSNPSPGKINKKKVELWSPRQNLIKIESSRIKASKRRTQSMNTDDISNTVNFISRCLYKTRVGQVNGRNKKENQDSFIIHSNLENNPSCYLFSVCDGHGVNGHQVSRYLKKSFVSEFEKFLKKYRNVGNSIEEAYSSAIKSCESGLKERKIDTQISGSTMVSVIIISNYLICANIGDSRAVLGRKTNGWVSEDLSRDHKPELEDESLRIRDLGGRVLQFRALNGQPLGPHRVWLPFDDIPGLAMSRSIGDDIAKSVGVCSNPEFNSRTLTKFDHFLIIASDGVWEFIDSQEAVQIVGSMLDSGKEAYAWSRIDGGVDDITVLVVFINHN